MENNWVYIIVWEIKRSGRVRDFTTLDKQEYQNFKEYLINKADKFEIIEDYVLELVEK
ncbi:MAG: hypothetical protein IJ501_05030 [Bacilli bacterium]|nr:hypothetical protein [Bacilli bacterium]